MLVSSSVDSVTLYSDRARIVRRGRARVEKGTGRLEVTSLPRGIDTESARVRLKGRLVLLSFDLVTVNFAETPAVDARELEKLLEEKTDALGILLRSLEQEGSKSVQARNLALQSRMFARGLALGRLDVGRQKEVFQFTDEMQAESSRQTARLEAEKRTLEREIAKLKQDLSSRQSQRSRSRLDAVIDYDCAEACEADVELVYVTRNAYWRPCYDLRFGERLGLHYMAQASQSTGEEWSNVSIELSTAALAASESIPEFGSWIVRPFLPVPPPAPQARSAAPAPGMYAAAAALEPAPMEAEEAYDAGFAQAEIRSGAVVSYGVQARTSLPGNGEVKKLTIAVCDFPFETDYVLAPKIQEAASRRGEFENTSELVLLAGSAQVFFAEDLVGKTMLEETIPAQKRHVFLGVESRIQVKRELKTHEADKKFLGDDRRLRWEYRIEMENLLEKEARLLLREQIPVSAHEAVKVKFECAEKPQEKDMGTLEWTFTLASRAKKTIEYALIIEHPRTMQLEGLP